MSDTPIDLRTDDGIGFEALITATESVAPFTPGAPFWADEYIADRLLEAHLDPDRDAASRPHDRIDAEVDWLIDALNLTPGDSVLDLGCGPGLYCERFDDRGLTVTGVDLSATAIDRARQRAAQTDRSITYHQADYRTMDIEDEYDAVILVYYDFGTFDDADRDAILGTVREALRSGGRFAFDVYRATAFESVTETTQWELHNAGGFWRPDQHLVLTETIRYPSVMAILDQHIVIDTTGKATIYRFWERYYDQPTIEEMLDAAGFELIACMADLRGTPLSDTTEGLGVLTTTVDN